MCMYCSQPHYNTPIIKGASITDGLLILAPRHMMYVAGGGEGRSVSWSKCDVHSAVPFGNVFSQVAYI